MRGICKRFQSVSFEVRLESLYVYCLSYSTTKNTDLLICSDSSVNTYTAKSKKKKVDGLLRWGQHKPSVAAAACPHLVWSLGLEGSA